MRILVKFSYNFIVIQIFNFMQKYFKPISEMLETKSGHFFIGFIVIINAIILGIQTFQSVPELLELFLRKIDKAILAIFVIELCIKLLGNGLSFFRSGWNNSSRSQ